MIYSYDWISLPLCYTQMVAVAVYGFFAITLISRQHNSSDPESFNTFFPIFTFLQFLLIVGWMKVGCVLDSGVATRPAIARHSPATRPGPNARYSTVQCNGRRSFG